MKLFLDTTTNKVSIITFDDNKIHQCIQYEGNNNHTTTIYDHLSTIKLNELEAIYVTSGPGSYTGVRIGVLVAKTLAHELKIKLYAINTLQLFFAGENKPVLLDARGKKYFRYDGSKFDMINYDDQSEEVLIDHQPDSKWFLNKELLAIFTEVKPNELKIDYMKDAI